MKRMESCGTSSHVFSELDISMDYESPTRGQPLKITRTFYNPEDSVEDGWIVNTLIIHDEITVRKNVTICSTTPCPIKHGKNDYGSWGIWPEQVKGDFTNTQEWIATDGRPLMCLNVSFDVGRDGYFNMDNYTYTNYTESDALQIVDIFMPHFPVIRIMLELITDPMVINPLPPTPTNYISTVHTQTQNQDDYSLSLQQDIGIGFAAATSCGLAFLWLWCILRKNWMRHRRVPKTPSDTFVHINPMHAEEWK
jgi:hypothetical protein